MKIIVCGSMGFSKKMIEVKEVLIDMGCLVVLPEFTYLYANMDSFKELKKTALKNKVEKDLIKKYFDEIKTGDAILVVNEKKNDKLGYIGGNVFLEMGFAFVLNKPIYLLNKVPKNMLYTDEIKAMYPIELNGDFTKIKEKFPLVTNPTKTGGVR